MKISRDLGLVKELDDEHVQAISGPVLAKGEDDDEYGRTVKHCKVFAKLTPDQKGKVIKTLRDQREVMGMLGDGINDCVALRAADIGISVNSGQNVTKIRADIILMEKELAVIAECVRVGRHTQGNTVKYIKMVLMSTVSNVMSTIVSTA